MTRFLAIATLGLSLLATSPALSQQDQEQAALQQQYNEFHALGNEFYAGLSSVWTSHQLRAQYCQKFIKEQNRFEFWTRSAYQSMLASFDMLHAPDSMIDPAKEWFATFPNDPFALATIAYYELYYNLQVFDPLSLSQRAAQIMPSYRYFIFFTEKHYNQYYHGLYNLIFSVQGWALAEAGQPEAAIALLYNAKENTPSTTDDMYSPAPYHYALGRAFEKAGKLDSALAHYSLTYRYGEGRNRWTHKALLDFSRLHNERHKTNFPLSDSLHIADSTLYAAMKPYLDYTGFYFVDITQRLPLPHHKYFYTAWADINNDGYADLLLNGSALLLNNGDGTFREGSVPSANARGGIFLDYDGDGNSDIFAFSYGGNALFKGDGKGNFSAQDSSVFRDTYSLHTEAALVSDFNNDGYPDIYVVNHEVWSPNGSTVHHDELWLNSGGRTFLDKTLESGAKSRVHAGRGAAAFDIDGDGDNDLLIANYRLQPNYLLLNATSGDSITFSDEAAHYNLQGTNTQGAFGHSTGTAIGDYNNDGIFDLFIGNMCHPRFIDFSDYSMLYRGDTSGFVESRRQAGIYFEETQTDAVFADFNGDGYEDLFVTTTYEDRRNMLYLNNGDGTFTESAGLVNARSFDGFGCAVADIDNDGDLDLIVGTGIVYQTGVRLFRNMLNDNEATRVQWLKIAVSAPNNTVGIGATVKITQEGRLQQRLISGSRGLGSQDFPQAYFAFGKNTAPVEVEITMPGQKTPIKAIITELNKLHHFTF